MRIPHRLLRFAVYAIHRKFTAGAVVVCLSPDHRVLLVQQVHGEAVWGFPGGLVNARETFAACAARELAEETGLVAELADLTLVATLPQEQARHIDVVFRLALGEYAEEVASSDHFEVRDAAWFAPDELPALRREARELLRRVPGLLGDGGRARTGA